MAEDPSTGLHLHETSWYGWKPSLPDMRDRLARPLFLGRRPPVVSLRSRMPPVWDQGSSGSCTAHATCAAIEYNEGLSGRSFIGPSRLFVYYNTRIIEGTVGYDAGGTVRDAIKSAAALGVCNESIDWPFDLTKMFTQPSPNCYANALQNIVTEYAQVGPSAGPSVDDLCQQLAGGEPIIFGTSIFASFESDQVAATGIVPIPNTSVERIMGGHCMIITGFDDNRQLFEVRNSWGDWGDAGHCWIPYNYMTNPGLTMDFWVIRGVK